MAKIVVAGGDSSDVALQLAGGVQSVTGDGLAFAAVKLDGSVVTWGDANAGGDSGGCGYRRFAPKRTQS